MPDKETLPMPRESVVVELETETVMSTVKDTALEFELPDVSLAVMFRMYAPFPSAKE